MFGQMCRNWRWMGTVWAVLTVALLIYAMTPPGQAQLAKGQASAPLFWAVSAVLLACFAIVWGGVSTLLPGLLKPGLSLALALLICTLASLHPAAEPYINGVHGWVILMAVWIATEVLLFLPWMGRFLRGDIGPQERRFTTRVAPEEVWPALYPVPGQLHDFAYADAEVSAPPEGSGADFLLSYAYERAADKRVRLLVHVTGYVAGRTASLRYTDLQTGLALETLAFALTPQPDGGTEVRITLTPHDAWPGLRLFCWLSGVAGNTAASLRARIERRADWSMHGRQFPNGRASR